MELRDRDRVIAHIVPEKQDEKPVKWPDFAARRRKIFGDRILPGADIVIEERGRLSVYADTSFCVSPYVQDSHSQAADELLGSGGRVLLAPLHASRRQSRLTCGTICATFSHAIG